VKIVIDTNIWISFLIGKILKNLKEHIFNEKIEIITSEEQIKEILTVLRRIFYRK